MSEAQATAARMAQVQYLKHLPRTGWLFAGIPQPESIAEHSFAVSWLAIFLAETINTNYRAQGLTAPLQIARILHIALVHDLAESSLTDLPKRSTELIGKRTKHQAEAAALAQIFDAMPNGTHYQACWQEYADGTTPEGRLVHDADKLEMIHQAFVYEQTGQRNLHEFWQGHEWYYPASRNLFDELCRLRSSSYQ